MGSIGSLLNTARSALMTYQSALQTTSQNIANVQNPNYSTQTSNYGTTTPVNHGGHTYGTGVKLDAINQKVNQRLENQLTKALSMKSAFEEQKLYVGMMEDLLTEGTKDSLGTLLNNFWNAWESLSNKPAGKTGQELVFKSGVNLSHRIKAIDTGLKELQVRLDRNIASGVGQVNLLTKKIADLNRAILSSEGTSGHANDLRDKRNALVDELGTYIDVDMVVKDDGSFHINTSGGLPLVSDHLSYPLEMKAGRVLWRGSSANVRDITDIISGGKLGGWLKVRDKALRETCAELDELASNLIWAMNYQHSQGAGAKYFSGPVAGNYSADGSGRLDSLKYGNRIDYSRDFLMVIKDASSYGIKYQKAGVDMGKSTAGISDINGNGRPGSTYKLTVVDKGRVGEQSVSETSGNLMGGVCADKSGTIADALDKALPDQTLTVKGKNGTKIIKIRDKGGNTGRSAGQIAKSLNDTDGVNAYASSTRAAFSLDGIQQAQDGDIVRFSLYANGVEKTVSFTVDSKAGTLKKQFEQALGAAANEINKTFKNTDLKVDGTVISSKSGATLGIQKFEVVDNAGVALDNFKNFNRDDKVFVTVTANSTPPVKIKVKVDLKDVDTSDSAKVGKAFYEALSDQLKDKPFTVKRDATSGKVILRTTDGSSLDLSAASGDTGNDARISVTALGGSTAVGGNQLDFNGTGKAGAAGVKSTGDYLGFSLPGCERSTNVSAASFVGEAGGSHNACAVITGSVTIKTDPGIQVFSDNTSAAGLFGKSGSTGDGNSIITLGGSGGYGKFDDGDNITFKLDGIDISYTVTAGAAPLTDAEQAQQLYDALNNTLPKDGYKVIRNGTSVTIVRTAEADKPVSITGFSDATGGDAALSVSTGTGKGVQAPKNKTLISNDASRNSVSAVTFGDPATLRWEELDGNGRLTGRSGHTKIDDPGRVEIKADGKVLLSFKVSEGNLVAGNTMRVNTDAGGKPDPLKVEVTGRGNRISDTYKFSVASGGSIPNNGEPIVVNWSSGNDSGSFTLKGGNPPLKAEVDGMTFHFNGGTLVKGDSFYVSTDENGKVPDKGGVDTSSD
ncbi:MAG: flagellar hook-associated protein FlgK, partial [Desulfobacterales bacterium]|nr:flagellar hook-associated protein FlgK [Desulfobacterales bacterium]